MIRNRSLLVSVIIPTYNRADTIERSIRSVLDQTYYNLEVIVIDDGSTDSTAEVVAEINDDRIRYYGLDKNYGACTARNIGIDYSHGEYIAFQDSDDEWMNDKIEKQIALLESKPEIDVCTCSVVTVWNNNKIYNQSIRTSSRISRKDIYSRRRINISTVSILAKRKVLLSIRFDPDVFRWQDYDWAIRASAKYAFFHISDILVFAYLSDNSISFGGNQEVIEINRFFIKKYKNEFENDKCFEASLYRNIAYFETLCRNRNASNSYLYALRLDPCFRGLIQYILAKFGILYAGLKLVNSPIFR